MVAYCSENTSADGWLLPPQRGGHPAAAGPLLQGVFFTSSQVELNPRCYVIDIVSQIGLPQKRSIQKI